MSDESDDSQDQASVKVKRSGSFPPGVSGNPGGRRRMTEPERSFLEANGMNALRVWARAMRARMADGRPDHDTRIKGADRIAERLWGKLPQAVTGEDGAPLMGGGGMALLALLEKLASPRELPGADVTEAPGALLSAPEPGEENDDDA